MNPGQRRSDRCKKVKRSYSPTFESEQPRKKSRRVGQNTYIHSKKLRPYDKLPDGNIQVNCSLFESILLN